MKVRQYGVFGLGDFGMNLAIALASHGCQVLAVDLKEERVQDIADLVTLAVRADITDVDTMNTLGIANLDGVIVCAGGNLEANIMGIMMAKEANVGYILAKARDDRTANIYRRLGANEIVFPEKMMGERIAKGILSGRFVDILELSSRFSMVELTVPESWVGKNLIQLDLRNRLKINVIAKKVGEELNMDIDPKAPMVAGDNYIIIGENDALERIK